MNPGPADLARVREEGRCAILVEDGEGERERRIRHIPAPNVEQPGDALRRRQDRGVGIRPFDASPIRFRLSALLSPV